MVKTLRAWLAASSLAFCLSGCGTVINVLQPNGPCPIYDQPEIYGGLRLHFMGPMWNSSPPWGLLFFLVDSPLSLVGDTITLPYTIPAAILAPKEPSKAARSP